MYRVTKCLRAIAKPKRILKISRLCYQRSRLHSYSYTTLKPYYYKPLTPILVQHQSCRYSRAPSSKSSATVNRSAKKDITILSLADLIAYSANAESMQNFAKFIYHELPVRISHRVVELGSLPYGLSNTRSITQLRDLYSHSFHSLRALPLPDTFEKQEQFIVQIMEHFERAQPAVNLVANGLSECIANNINQRELIESCPYLNQFLDRFHSARIGTRLITGHFIAARYQLQAQKQNTHDDTRGVIDFSCNPKTILEMAIDDASLVCENGFGKCPDVRINSQNFTFPYIPTDLHYIFFEIMKNSLRAVCEHFPELSSDQLPPVKVVIVASDQELTVKISDLGGGISKQNMEKIMYYSFSTVEENQRPIVSTNGDQQPVMAGFGYGLPLSRLYAKHFGGDLEIISMDGYGTDAFIYLNWLKVHKRASSDSMGRIN